jgi:hypothetical protein
MSDRLASIGALAAGLGHDMNNVLLPVRAHLEAARTMTMKPAVRDHIDAVHRSVTYLQELADGLHFLALDAEGDDTERAATDVAAWWAQVGPLLTKAVPKHVRVSAAFEAGLPEVAVAAHGLTQAVLNLMVNAGEAIPAPTAASRRGGKPGLVRISARLDEPGTHVILGVTDNGRGMSAETQRRAFEMFYTTSARGLGTGLGLPLLARVVARAGGAVHIESRPRKGTTMSLLLPVAGNADRRSPVVRAAIAITDGRVAAMICHLLGAAGAQVSKRPDPAAADVWVAEATREGLRGANVWRKQHPRGSLVLLGTPDRRHARSWKSLRPHTTKNSTDLDALRLLLGEAISEV